MNKITVLIEGYARENVDGTWNASPSVTLVESGGKKVLVDAGANDELLLERLAIEGHKPEDIDIIFLTHHHPDHFLSIRLFPGKPICDGAIVFEGDKETPYQDVIPGTDIKLLPTPGHASEHTALVVEVDGETFVIAQDVFWWTDGMQKSDKEEDLMSLADPFMKDENELRASRQKVLEIADWIIPGHGKMFKNPRRHK